MTTSEDWSYQFDLLYNNISSNQAPGLTEYEKSVFLTQAQEAVILDLYKGTLGDSFETTEEVTRYLSSLVISTPLYNIDEDTHNIRYIYELPQDCWFIVYHSAKIFLDSAELLPNSLTRDVMVVPTKHSTLTKDLNNPFRGPNKNKVLMVSEGNTLELFSKYPVSMFNIKYLKKPTPIVLENSELDVNGVEDFNVEIPESLHNQVLIRAVQMAKAVWAS